MKGVGFNRLEVGWWLGSRTSGFYAQVRADVGQGSTHIEGGTYLEGKAVMR